MGRNLHFLLTGILFVYHNQFQTKEINPATSNKKDLYVFSIFFEEYITILCLKSVSHQVLLQLSSYRFYIDYCIHCLEHEEHTSCEAFCNLVWKQKGICIVMQLKSAIRAIGYWVFKNKYVNSVSSW